MKRDPQKKSYHIYYNTNRVFLQGFFVFFSYFRRKKSIPKFVKK